MIRRATTSRTISAFLDHMMWLWAEFRSHARKGKASREPSRKEGKALYDFVQASNPVATENLAIFPVSSCDIAPKSLQEFLKSRLLPFCHMSSPIYHGVCFYSTLSSKFSPATRSGISSSSSSALPSPPSPFCSDW